MNILSCKAVSIIIVIVVLGFVFIALQCHGNKVVNLYNFTHKRLGSDFIHTKTMFTLIFSISCGYNIETLCILTLIY